MRFNGVEKLVEDARDAVNEFTMLDNLGKNLAKTFGSASKFVDDSLISGRVGLDGSLNCSHTRRDVEKQK